MRRLAYLVLRSEDTAEDAIQDIFVNLWERRTTLEVSGSLAGYLFRATRYRALNLLRHEQAQERLRNTYLRSATSVTNAAYNEGDLHIAATELDAVIQSALDTLQPRAREIFQMHRELGMSYAEIADTLGITVTTIHSQMSRAVNRIAKYVAIYQANQLP
jgi:RNA polymerase sigma-70 factor (ECF subfamily)